MKKILLVVIAVMLCVSVANTPMLSAASFTTKLAANEQITQIPDRTDDIKEQYLLYSLDDVPQYILSLYQNGGYSVALRTNGVIIEYAPKASNPYVGVHGKWYYAGPLSYVQRTNEGFYTIWDNRLLKETELLRFFLS